MKKIYKRNCPKCNIELTTPNKYYYISAIEKNTPCLSCSLKGKPFSEEHKKNLSKNHADVNGDNNPFKGKKHKKESIDKMLDTRDKHPTWRKNSSERMKHIRKSYWGDNNPMNNPESVAKIRLKRIDEIKLKNKGQISPNYSKVSIPIIEQYGIDNNYKFQHAENGGELYIKEFGYWVDGYGKDNNVVIEYDESHHFVSNGVMEGEYTKRDLRRQRDIQNLLKCKFIRIDYKGNVRIFDYIDN
jgi:hypothetical protein